MRGINDVRRNRGLAFGVIAVVLLFVGCFYWNASDKRGYPNDVREQFLAACAARSGPNADCECLMDAVEDRLTLKEYRRYEQSFQTFSFSVGTGLGTSAEASFEAALASCG